MAKIRSGSAAEVFDTIDDGGHHGQVLSSHPSQVKYLPVDKLRIDRSYYRDASGPTVEQFTRSGFDPVAAGSLTVNKRENGDYYLIDGQHRLFTARQCEVDEVRCVVYEGLTYEQEALYFERLNTARHNPTPAHRMKAQIARRYEPAVAVQEAVEDAGFHLSFTNDAKNPAALNAIRALQQMYAFGGKEIVGEVLGIVRDAWPNDPHGKEALVLKAVFMFVSKYRGDYDRDRLVGKLRGVLPQVLRQKGRQIEYTLGSGGPVLNLFRAILELYNEAERKKLKYKDGSPTSEAEVSDQLATEIGRKYATETWSINDLGAEYGLSPATIRDIVNRKRWEGASRVEHIVAERATEQQTGGPTAAA